MGTRNQVGIELSCQATQPGRIGSLESILGLFISLKILALATSWKALVCFFLVFLKVNYLWPIVNKMCTAS
jgi:hypothetical protein